MSPDPAATHAPQRLRLLAFEAMRFIGSGLVAFPLGLGVAALCRELFGWRKEVATVAAFATLLLVNFMLGRRLVFRSSGNLKHEFARFMGAAVLMRSLESLLSILLLEYAHIPYLASIAVTLAISSMVKFFLYRTWVFSRPAPAAAIPDRRSP